MMLAAVTEFTSQRIVEDDTYEDVKEANLRDVQVKTDF